MASCTKRYADALCVNQKKRFYKLVSNHRFRIEQCFGTMKRLFGLHQARYFGVAKNHAQMVMPALSQNLLKAANKIILNKQTPAIAKRKLTTPIRPLKSQRTGEHVCSNCETQKHHHAVV